MKICKNKRYDKAVETILEAKRKIMGLKKKKNRGRSLARGNFIPRPEDY